MKNSETGESLQELEEPQWVKSIVPKEGRGRPDRGGPGQQQKELGSSFKCVGKLAAQKS